MAKRRRKKQATCKICFRRGNRWSCMPCSRAILDRCAVALTVLPLAAVAVIVAVRRHDLYGVAGGIAAGLAVRAMFALVVRSCDCGRVPGSGHARS